MELLVNNYQEDTVAFKLVESVNRFIQIYEEEGKKISDKDRTGFIKYQSDLETYGNKVVRGKVISLLSVKDNSSYEIGLKKLRDSLTRMLIDNNQLGNKKIKAGRK